MTVSAEVLEPFGLIGSAVDPDFASIARLAAQICGVPTATVNLLDEVSQHSVAPYGFAGTSVPLRDSICQHTVQLNEPLYVTDARTDARLARNPQVDGTLGRIVFYAGTQLRTASGDTVGTLCVFDEVTHELDDQQRAALDELAAQAVQLLELRAQAAALQVSNSELTRSNINFANFAGRVAHDLRNPGAAASGFLRLALGPLGDELTGRARECVQQADGALERMARLIDDLLGYAKVGGQLRLEEVDLRALVQLLRTDLRALLDSTGGQVLLGDLPTVYTDRTLLSQLLQNLVSNGLKYSRPGVPPVVTVSASADDDGWQVAVSDNGRGIPVSDRAEVFELFTRLPEGRDVAGTGIGLATCAGIAAALRGSLTITDGARGGTTFTLRVPDQAFA